MSVLLDIITRLGGRIEGGSEYGWDCYGPNARHLEFPNVGVVFDSVTQEVYEVSAWPNNYDSSANGHIFWVTKDYEVAYRKECKRRKIVPDGEQCYSFPSMMLIAEAVIDELPFDDALVRDVELFFEEGELELIQSAAQAMGMTFDEFVNAALKEKLDTVKSKKKAKKRAK